LFSSPASRAQIPAIADVPTCAADRASLEATHSSLLAQRADLKARAARQNSNCVNIPENSPQNGPCQASQSQLQSQIASYAEAVKTFNARASAANQPCSPEAGHPHPKIGAATAVTGTVYWLTSDGRKIPITTSTPVYLNAHIITEGDGHMQILLLDETVFTLGPNSDMVLDEFVYDPATTAGKLTASVIKGTFRFITGKVSHKDPTSYRIKLPVDAIGIRGTDFEVHLAADNSGTIQLYKGQIDVTENQSGRVVHLNAGQTLVIAPDGGLTVP
jgi:ferric-dicitrate binding protein FerR (iron transport regulator)